MPLTPRLNKKVDKNSELVEQCTAAFICITNNSSDRLKSKSQLLKGKTFKRLVVNRSLIF